MALLTQCKSHWLCKLEAAWGLLSSIRVAPSLQTHRYENWRTRACLRLKGGRSVALGVLWLLRTLWSYVCCSRGLWGGKWWLDHSQARMLAPLKLKIGTPTQRAKWAVEYAVLTSTLDRNLEANSAALIWTSYGLPCISSIGIFINWIWKLYKASIQY